ncbi:MAG: CoA transferase [Actinomycetota bacterium]|nr:MAG: CoA transferase [Actinomycetota bacterium]
MEPPKLLEGIKVIESASVISGPFAGGLLSHMGADVIKVEAPGGDRFRGWDPAKKAVTPSFEVYNSGKRSIVLDLKKDAGKAVFKRLVESADAMIENSRPGAMDRLGLGWDELKRHNPSLVYCYVSGLGSWGPLSSQPTYDAVAQAMSGLWSQFTDMSAPEPVGPAMADQLTGLYAAFAILAGIQNSRRTGTGTKLEISMLAACVAFQGSNLASFLYEGEPVSKRTRAEMSQSYALVSRDGLPFAIHLSTPQKFWEGLCQVIGKPELISDPRFSSKRERVKNYELLRQILQEAASGQEREWWLENLRAHDVPSAPILTLQEAVVHPQVKALGIIDMSAAGGPRINSPIAVERKHLGAKSPAPLLAANTEDILAEIGITTGEIAQLRNDRVIS